MIELSLPSPVDGSRTIAQCHKCGLYRYCESPKMAVSGEGKRKILIVGEAPGGSEDVKGIQFVGSTGTILREALSNQGLNPQKDCWFTNAIICRPEGNRDPTPNEIRYCYANIYQTIHELEPEIIIPVGKWALYSVMLNYARIKAITQWTGYQIPDNRYNAWICPVWHPSFIAHAREENKSLPDRIWEKHLSFALNLEGRPWKRIPSWESKVECITEPIVVTKAVQEIIEMDLPSAFDYETDRLKPDKDESTIWTVAISNGKRTIAYPFYGAAVSATYDFLQSDLPKIAANAKFEERWTVSKLGSPIQNWIWDTMQMSHIIDNRDGVTSLKFHSVALLGVGTYNDYIDQFWDTGGDKSCYAQNRIREAELHKVLIYNGLDALFEYCVYELQKSQLEKGTIHEVGFKPDTNKLERLLS